MSDELSRLVESIGMCNWIFCQKCELCTYWEILCLYVIDGGSNGERCQCSHVSKGKIDIGSSPI